MPDEDFVFWMDNLLRRTGFDEQAIERITLKCEQGRAKLAGTEEDFDLPGFDHLTESQLEGCDKCVYQAKYLYNLLVAERVVGGPDKQQRQITTLVDGALRLEAVADNLIQQAITIAQTAACQCEEKQSAGCATGADGQCVHSPYGWDYMRYEIPRHPGGMECAGNNDIDELHDPDLMSFVGKAAPAYRRKLVRKARRTVAMINGWRPWHWRLAAAWKRFWAIPSLEKRIENARHLPKPDFPLPRPTAKHPPPPTKNVGCNDT